MVSGIVAAVAMVILDKVSKKYPKFTEYNLGISMIIGWLQQFLLFLSYCCFLTVDFSFMISTELKKVNSDKKLINRRGYNGN